MENSPTQVHVSNVNYQEQPNNKISSEEDQNSANESEYDSAGSYSDDEQGKRKGQDSRGSGEQSDGDDVAPERESGDGQESLPQKKVDDDEDKKNPQYIPKRGTFYEHDDRTLDEAENAAKIENEKEKDGKKKIWNDKKEKWSHDRFNDSEQMPKSKSELVSIYGYDIRNEEGPPRARRRRRYGRGPNKYTRNWEDEDAYNKPPATRIKKPPPKDREQMDPQEEFPPLEDTRIRSTRSQEFRNKTHNKSPKNSQDQNISKPPPPPPERIERSEPRENPDAFKLSPRPAPRDPPARPAEQKPQRVGSGRVIKPQREIKDSDYKGFTSKSRQNRNFSSGVSEQQVIIKSHNSKDYNRAQKSDSVDEIARDVGSMSVQDNGYKGKYGGGNRQGSMPPRLQNEQKGGKRYSSMRQRSLPETANPPQFNQHANYYSGEYQQPQGVQQQQPPQNLIPATTTAVPAQMLAAPLAIPPQQQVPVTAAAMLQAAQPQFPPPPFAQPGAALFQPAPPPPFIAQQQPQLINYPPQFPPGYQGFQQQFSPVVSQSLNIIETPPTELYQPQGGITYYSTDQQLMQRSVPQKRPKAAIPIVPPPDVERGRTPREEDQSSMSPSGGEQLSEYLIEDAINAGYVQENNDPSRYFFYGVEYYPHYQYQ